MHILHIGSLLSQHTQIAAILYRSLGYDAVFLNTSRGFAPPTVPGLPDVGEVISPWKSLQPKSQRSRLRMLTESLWAIGQYFGFFSSDRALHQAVTGLLDTHSIDLVVGTWGTPVLIPMRLVQTLAPDCAYIHNILTYPELPVLAGGMRGAFWKAFSFFEDRAKRRAYHQMLAACDIRIHPSRNMLDFLKHEGGISPPGEDVIRLERFPRQFFPVDRMPKLSAKDGEPHLIHIGATNFRGGSLDNLMAQFTRMAEAGIHVHFYSKQPLAPTNHAQKSYLHVFPKFPNTVINGALAEFMTQFDASLMLYNVGQPYVRFANALPTRLLFSFLAGIPNVLPKGLFVASEEYIVEHQIGFAYQSERELAQILHDRERIRAIELNSIEHSTRNCLDDHVDSYSALFERARAIRQLRAHRLKE